MNPFVVFGGYMFTKVPAWSIVFNRMAKDSMLCPFNFTYYEILYSDICPHHCIKNISHNVKRYASN